MTTEIEKAAERVAKLKAQAEKLSGPLANAQAQLQEAQEAETARRAERAAVYPWFVAFVEFRSARHKRRHVLDEAQRAQTTLGEVRTIPEQRWYSASLLDDIVSHADKKAEELAAKFSRELNEKREAYISAKD
ncbi:hypothetical protein OIE62_15925 [Streptomyces scopuliridis]|uniref:Uncharacterized protein n=1 Tax=Streptomyces scopuliridis TaxID=452529 RepID=A0ACD4ZP17_9ACTN|nr:hypothetical protein [Streptomyces scopuliridis]WSB99934.1 hypothetical protein OG835_25030 [Streptomyces scopuliridis]WSC06367.1 hypothetical protein OIE62_15925 [Streptomyces scopuliridis]